MGIFAQPWCGSGVFFRGGIAFENTLLDFFDNFGEHGGVFCFHNVRDACGGDEHASHEFFGGFPELDLFFGWSEVEIGDQFSESLFIHLLAVVVVPLDDFLLVGGVIAVAHGVGLVYWRRYAEGGKAARMLYPEQSMLKVFERKLWTTSSPF